MNSLSRLTPIQSQDLELLTWLYKIFGSVVIGALIFAYSFSLLSAKTSDPTISSIPEHIALANREYVRASGPDSDPRLSLIRAGQDCASTFFMLMSGLFCPDFVWRYSMSKEASKTLSKR